MNVRHAGTEARHLNEEDRRLRAAFSASLILHVAVLWLWWNPAVLLRAVNQGAITVSFLKSSVTETGATPPVPVAINDAVVLVSDKLDDPEIAASLKPPSAKPAPAVVQSRLQEAVTPKDASSENPVAPGVTQRPDLRIGEASVLMLVDPSGRPGEIYWNELPALSNEQLHLIELRMRQHRYEHEKRGRAVTEIVNVFEILRGASPIRSPVSRGNGAPLPPTETDDKQRATSSN